MTRLFWIVLAACGSAPASHALSASRAPIALTYLGVAGWQLEAVGKIVLTDPYLSRPVDPTAPLVPDAAAIAAHTPPRAAPELPMRADDYREGGTFAYLIRIAGHEVLVFDTANFVERELVGIHPDIAIIAPGARDQIHGYTCRLLHVLGDPPTVIATHFDDWKGPPIDAPLSDDLAAFAAEVRRCSPASTLIVPRHFERMTF